MALSEEYGYHLLFLNKLVDRELLLKLTPDIPNIPEALRRCEEVVKSRPGTIWITGDRFRAP